MKFQIIIQKFFGSIKSFFVWIYSKFFDNDNKPEQLIFATILVFLVIIIVNIIYYSFGSTCCLTQKILTNSLLILTCFIFGGIVGVIFGFPKQVQNQANVKGEISGYIRNTNIDLIADWLSKLLVGATIAQINNVLTFIQDLSTMFYGKYDQNFGLVCLAITFITGLIYGHYIAFHVIHEHFQDEHLEDLEQKMIIEGKISNQNKLNEANLQDFKDNEIEINLLREEVRIVGEKLQLCKSNNVIEEDVISKENNEFECPPMNIQTPQIEIFSNKEHFTSLKRKVNSLKTSLNGWDDDSWQGFSKNFKQISNLEITVSPNIIFDKEDDIYEVNIKFIINSKDDSAKMEIEYLKGKYIAVILHPTFNNHKLYVLLEQEKEDTLKGELTFFSYEGFTILILMLLSDLSTFVATEYDLSKTPKKPKGFN